MLEKTAKYETRWGRWKESNRPETTNKHLAEHSWQSRASWTTRLNSPDQRKPRPYATQRRLCQKLNPYDVDAVQDLLNLTDDNYICKCSHELKSEHDESGVCHVTGCNCKAKRKVRRQLWGVSIAAKR